MVPLSLKKLQPDSLATGKLTETSSEQDVQSMVTAEPTSASTEEPALLPAPLKATPGGLLPCRAVPECMPCPSHHDQTAAGVIWAMHRSLSVTLFGLGHKTGGSSLYVLQYEVLALLLVEELPILVLLLVELSVLILPSSCLPKRRHSPCVRSMSLLNQ